MTIRLPTVWYGNLRQAIRELAAVLQQILKDDSKTPRWDDVWMLGNAIASADNPKPPIFDTTEYAYRFTSSATNLFGGAIQMPHKARCDGPDPIIGHPHLHIYSRSAASTTGSAKHIWRLRWRWYGANKIQSSSWQVQTKTFTATGVAGRMQIASFDAVTASYTINVSSLFKFEIAKLPGGGNRVFYVDQADTHVEFDTDRGSHLETRKWERSASRG